MKYLIALLLAVCFMQTVQACTVTDDAGNKIILVQPAQRIISLAPDLTEILFAVGAQNQIAGVVKGSDYPEAAKKLTIVGNYNSINLEKILLLHADLILVWGEGSFTQSLKKLSIPVYVSHPKKIEDIAKTIQRLGCLTGHEKKSNAIAQAFTDRYQQLKQTYSHQKKISVFYQVWQQPLITISKESWINDVIELCGGKNIFANLTGVAPKVNLEAVILANPEVIIGAETPTNWQRFWRRWPKLSAVEKNHFISVNPDLIERASPRLLEGVGGVCDGLSKLTKHVKI